MKVVTGDEDVPGEAAHLDPLVRAEDHLPDTHHLHGPGPEPADLQHGPVRQTVALLLILGDGTTQWNYFQLTLRP